MTLVDASVWIDFFNGKRTPSVEKLTDLLTDDVVATGDLVLAEVLQGFRSEKYARRAEDLLLNLTFFEMFNADIALTAAEHCRFLRKKGHTIRSSVDIWIATFCLQHGLSLLHSDRDFIYFARHFKLKCA